MQSEIRQMKDRLKQDFAKEVHHTLIIWKQRYICFQVSTLEEEIEELRRKFEASKDLKNSRSSKSDNFGLLDEGRGSRYIFFCMVLLPNIEHINQISNTEFQKNHTMFTISACCTAETTWCMASLTRVPTMSWKICFARNSTEVNIYLWSMLRQTWWIF